MQPNRKARREQKRRAVKNHAKEREERPRAIRKRAPLKPPNLVQHRDTLLFGVQYDGVKGTVEIGIGWLCAIGSTLFDYITVVVTVLVASLSGTEIKTAPCQLTSGATIVEIDTSFAEDAARNRFRHNKESTSDEVNITRSTMKTTSCTETSEATISVSAETESLVTTHSRPTTSDDSDDATTAPSASFVSSPRSSISTDTPSGKSTDSLWYLQEFDKTDVQRLRKCLSNDNLERHIWARDDEDALNHVPRNIYFSEEISCWWSDEANDG